MFNLLTLVCLATLLACPAESGTTSRPLPANPQQMMQYWISDFFTDGDCLTEPAWQGVFDGYDTDDDGRLTVQEFHDNDLYTYVLGEPYGARSIFIYHDLAMGEPDGIVVTSESANYTYNILDENDDGCVTEVEFRDRMPVVMAEEVIIRDTLKAIEVGK